MLDAIIGLNEDDALLWEPLRVVPPDPWAGHIPFAFWLVRAMRPGTFVELGTHSGNSYFAFCQGMAACEPTGRAYAVDTWQGDEHAGEYGEDVFADVAAFNTQHFRAFSTLMRTTFDEARAYFPSGGIDLLHIDGMHTFEAVQHDYETWQDALSDRAVVVFHDINVRERNFGVWRLWHELSAQHPSFAFDHSNGLGVLGVGRNQTDAMQALFALSDNPHAAAGFRRRVSARGEAFQWQVAAQTLQAQMRSLDAQARSLEARAQSPEAQAHSRDAEISDAEQRAGHGAAQALAEIRWRDALIGAKQEHLAAKDAEIVTLRGVIDARAHSLAVRDRIIEARDGLAAELLRDLNHQRFMVSEERRVRDEMQADYEKEITRIALQREDIRGSMLHEVEAARHHTATAVAATYVGSTSWKVTRPLRVASRLLRGGAASPPVFLPPPLPPAPQAAAALPAPEPTVLDVTAPTPLKQALRSLFAAQLQAFLSGPGRLALPRAEQPDVSIVLVLHNQAELTFACLRSIVETLLAAPFGVEVVIADNGSTDATADLLDRLDGATVLRNGANLHFLRAVNLAAGSVRGRAILLLNNDAQLLPGAVQSALRLLDSDDAIGAVGARIILPDGTLQEAGSIIWQDGSCSGFARGEDPSSPDAMAQRNVDYCSGAFLLTPAALFREMGGLDVRYAPAYYEETDYCVRLWKAGRRVVYDPDATILHYEFGSSVAAGDAIGLQAANRAIFAAQHGDWLSRQFPVSPLNVMAARKARCTAPRILVLEDRVPKPELGSGYPRANRLARELMEAGADVTFFPMTRFKEDWHSVRKALDKRVEVLIAADWTQLRHYLGARLREFDAILVCRPHNMEWLLEAVGPDRHLLGDATILYDAEALFVTRTLQAREAEGRPASPEEKGELIAKEVALTRLAKKVISVAPAEQATLEDYGARDVHLLGHALEDEPIATAFAERNQVVIVGAMPVDHAPNADSVRWFATEILPLLRRRLGLPDLQLTVIGNAIAPSITAMDGKELDIVGQVAELAPALARARIMVAPTRFAAGIPHKVHQAAMLGIPMVVTGIIAGQVGWKDGMDLLVADDPAAFADACARLWTDAALWETVRGNALAKAKLDCSPAQFTKRVREIVSQVPVVHRMPESVPQPKPIAPPLPPSPEPNVSRPAASDWSVAVPFGFMPTASQPRLAVICHVFYPEIMAEIAYYLRKLPVPADLFLSTDSAEKRDMIGKALGAWEGGSVEMRVVPNRGRDIAPKLVGFADVHGRYDLVLHLHSKASHHAAFLEPWRSYLYETLLGSPEIVRSVLGAFAQLPDLGMVAPQHFQAIRPWLGWNGNFARCQALAARMGIALRPGRALDFPSGSMFWARPAALRPLLDLGLSFEDFPEEGSQVDHTPAHAIERLYFHACERSGHSWLKVTQPALVLDTSAVVTAATPAALNQFVADHGIMLSGSGPVPVQQDAAPMMMRVPPGLSSRLAARSF